MVKGERTEEALFQYDIYSGEFLYVNEKAEQQVLKQSVIDEIIITDSKESFRFKRVDPDAPMRFFDVIYESPSLLIYNDPEINFYEGKEQGVNRIDPRFSRQDNVYVLKDGVGPQKIKIKQKDIVKLLNSEQKQSFEKYLKTNKIKLKKLTDMKKAFLAINH